MRLARGGRKKVPFYHIVAADSRRARDSRYIERLGYYNPLAKEGEIKFHMKEERVDYWFGVGAQASDALAKLMVKEGKGPQKIRDEFTKRLNRRIEVVKKRDEAKAKAEAAAKAKEDAAAAAENVAAEAAAPAVEDAAPAEAAVAETASESEAQSAEPKEAAAAEDASDAEAPAEDEKTTS
jgi:small subunit ribosomal protein S16